jgi:hypothetical protein
LEKWKIQTPKTVADNDQGMRHLFRNTTTRRRNEVGGSDLTWIYDHLSDSGISSSFLFRNPISIFTDLNPLKKKKMAVGGAFWLDSEKEIEEQELPAHSSSEKTLLPPCIWSWDHMLPRNDVGFTNSPIRNLGNGPSQVLAVPATYLPVTVLNGPFVTK